MHCCKKSLLSLQLALVFISLLIFNSAAYAQSNEIQAETEIQTAKADLSDKQYRGAIRHLEEAKRLLGQTTPEVQSLMVQGFVGLEYYDDAREELEVYFKIANENSFNYSEMVKMVSHITYLEGLKENQLAQKKLLEEEEQQFWAQAKLTRSVPAVQAYLNKFPAGEHILPAQNYINLNNSIAQEKQIADSLKKKVAKRKRSKTGWFITGLVVTTAGGLIFLQGTGDREGIGGYQENSLVAGTLIGGTGGTIMFGSLISDSKKRAYNKQLKKVEDLQQQLRDFDLR